MQGIDFAQILTKKIS